MELIIDGLKINAEAGESLLSLVKRLDLEDSALSRRPIAAKIAGEVFSLNYIPVRRTQSEADRSSVRRAMAASGGKVHLLRCADPTGRDVYTRTAQAVVFMAMDALYPNARAKMNCTIGNAVYYEVLTDAFSLEALKGEIERIVKADMPFLRRRIVLEDAMKLFPAKVEFLRHCSEKYYEYYTCGSFADSFFGELAPSTGYLTVWDIRAAEGGFFFLLPDAQSPDVPGAFREMPRFFSVFSEGERWCSLMACENVAALNALTESGGIRELIRVNEALHEKRYSQVADMVCRKNAQAVMLAGPSSSGKTTSANRLAIQLRVHGKKPILMSLDDYYMDRDLIAPGPDGKVDYEHINTIDTPLFAQHMKALLAGNEVELPSFNFKTGKREWRGHKLRLSGDTVIIVEGLHALNPVLLPVDLDKSKVFRLYVSPLLPLNLDDHNRIPTSLLRLLRRTVRDYETRNSSVQNTMAMWDGVRRGERRWIFPFQENADVIFNSSTLYELAVLKKHIYPLLLGVQPEDECYDDVRAIVKILNFVREADVDDEIPPTSLVREFIGGNSFYR